MISDIFRYKEAINNSGASNIPALTLGIGGIL